MNKKILTFGLALGLLAAQQANAVVSVRTSIDVTAEIASSIRVVYDLNADVTEGSVQVKLEDTNGYMNGMTKSFHFIGNANMVNLKLDGPTGLRLVGAPTEAVVMPIGSTWYSSPTKQMSSTGFQAEAKVYGAVADIPATDQGIYIRFVSAQRTETYPLGSYKGAYTLTVTPKS